MTPSPAKKHRKNELEIVAFPPPELLFTLEGQGLELWRTHLEHVAEQERNAQVMPPEMLERLAETIRRDGRLESIPFVVRRDTPAGEVRFEMVSGHHRLRAARAAGLESIVVLADPAPLGRSQVVAKQLAHNQLAGTPDPRIVAEMFAEIETLEDALEAYVDPEQLAAFIDNAVPMNELEEPEPEWHLVDIAFLPAQFSEFTRLLDRLQGGEEMLCLSDMTGFAEFQKLVVRIKGLEDIRNVSGQLVRICELAHERLDELQVDACG